ncbi:MAG: JAB domain-containing protein, partial [Eubacteriales bacterium]|nr:JAB domain-containing protein [Eubacteriales bacterium]
MNSDLNIKEMPAELRPYEKCEALGAEYLSDPELLAVIIRCGTNNVSSVALAEKLLYPGGNKLGFNALMNSSLEEFREIRGIGRVKAIQLACLGEICRRMSRERAKEHLDIRHPETVAEYYMQQLKGLSEEEVHIMLLDTKSRLIRSQTSRRSSTMRFS